MNDERVYSLSELMELYNDNDPISFEEYFCDEIDFPPPTDADHDGWFKKLTDRFGASKFSVTPRHDHIRWRGELNSDFRIREI